MLYPNPSTNGRLNLSFTNTTTKDVMITDASGRLMKRFTGITDSALIVESLPAGYYTIGIVSRTEKDVLVLKATATPNPPKAEALRRSKNKTSNKT